MVNDSGWKQPEVIVVVAAIVVGAAVTIGYGTYQAKQPDSPDEHLAQCRADHGALSRPPKGSVFAQGTWTDCSWPPAPGADADGLGKIELTRVDDPDQAAAEYLGADVFSTKCSELEVRYRHDQQGNVIVLPKTTVSNEQVLGLDFSSGLDKARLKPDTIPARLDVDPDAADRLIVIVPIAVSVQHVACK